ncbi:MAG: fibronectin type III domain-containing protein, partial [Bacteroidales bacterium]|nr:fibronectin type III domain-containing protein [Bacteroidales bacterium]
MRPIRMIKNLSKSNQSQLVYYFIYAWLLIGAMLYCQNVNATESSGKTEQALAVPTAPTTLTVSVKSSKALELTWSDNSDNETGFKIERSLNADTNFESVAILAANSTYLMQHGLSSATTYYYRVSAINDDGDSDFSEVASATTNANASELPYYWNDTAIGTPRLEGSASYEKGYFEIQGQGWFDVCHFIYQPMQGDGEIVAQLVKSPKDGSTHHGLMIKETLERKSKYAMNHFYRSQEQITFFARKQDSIDPIKIENEGKFNIPIWMKLKRLGDTCIAFASKDGVSWEETHRESITMNENVYIGIVAYSNNDTKYSKGTWRDVAISQSADQLAPPTNLKAVPSPNDEVILTWKDNSDNETSFRIERAEKGDTIIFEDIAEIQANTTSYADDGLTPGSTYYYRVIAVDDKYQSFPSNEEKVTVLEIPYTILLMQRLFSDDDKTSKNNIITVTKTADTISNKLRHPGMIGKQIDVTLDDAASSMNASIAFKIMPNTHLQTVEFFSSEKLSISQADSQLTIVANGTQNTFDVPLDSLTCNLVVLRLNNGMMSTYVNGQWFDDIDVGTFTVSSFSLNEFNGNLWDIHIINSQISDESIYSLAERCVSAVEPSTILNSSLPVRHCGVYTCHWVENESKLKEGRQRAYLHGQEIIYDKNTFTVGMYDHRDIDDWVNRDRNIISNGFDDFKLDDLFYRNEGYHSYWLHENFHG